MPLAEFRGRQLLGIWVVVSPAALIWKELTIEPKIRTQALLCFDMSQMMLGQLNVNCSLVESGRLDILSEVVREIPSDLNLNPQILVVTTTDPWIVLRVMNV